MPLTYSDAGVNREMAAVFYSDAGTVRTIIEAYYSDAGVNRLVWVSTAAITLVGGTVSHTALSPADASATYLLNNTGTETSTPAIISNTWLRSGAAADYDVRATVTAGVTPTGSLTATWLNLGTSRTWQVLNTNNATSTLSATLTIEVRNAATLTVLATATVTLTAEVTL